MTTTTEQLQALLDLAGITPTDDEVDRLVELLPDVRARLERMWAVELGDTAPSLVFRAAEAAGPIGGGRV